MRPFCHCLFALRWTIDNPAWDGEIRSETPFVPGAKARGNCGHEVILEVEWGKVR